MEQPSISTPQPQSLSAAQPQSLSAAPQPSLSEPQPSLSEPQPSLSAAAPQPSLSAAAPQPSLSAAAPQKNKLGQECLKIIQKVFSKNPALKELIVQFLNFGCAKKIIGAGANGVVFLTFQNQIIKICFSPYSDIYQNKYGDWRCYTLNLIISLGVTALCDYEITGGKYMGLRQYMSLQSFTLNQILTSLSTSDFIVSCMIQLVALVLKLWQNGLIHNDVKPINIMLSPEQSPEQSLKQSKKRKRPCSDDEQKYKMLLIDTESIVDYRRFRSSNATPPYSMTTVGPTGNALYMIVTTIISCLCFRLEYNHWFHEGGLHIIPDLVTSFCKENHPLDTIKKVIHKLLGYEQSPIVVNMLVSLIYAIALNSCEVHPQKVEYTEFITTHFPQLAPFL
jgi:hypothetical protein